MKPLIGPFDPMKIELFDMGSGPLTIYSFGVLVALGFWLGSIVGQRKSVRDNIDPEILNRLVGWLVAGVFVGGHLGHALFYEPKYYMENPMELLRVWDGISSFGGFIACAIIVYVIFKRLKAPVLALGDMVFYGLAMGWGFGRLGCFSVHDHPGTQTDFFLGVYGTCPGTGADPLLACHPLGLYEAIHSFALFGLFMILERGPKRWPGFYVFLSCITYGPLRFYLDTLRHPDTDARYFGLTPAQYGSIVVTLIGIGIWVAQRNKAPGVPLKDGTPGSMPKPDAAEAAAG